MACFGHGMAGLAFCVTPWNKHLASYQFKNISGWTLLTYRCIMFCTSKLEQEVALQSQELDFRQPRWSQFYYECRATAVFKC